MKHQVNSSWVSNGNLGSARWYDAAPSWLTPDPLAEKAPSISPYVYCADNPVNAIDPDGKKVVDTKGRNIFYIDSKGTPQITNHASSNDQMLFEGMMLTKTGKKQLRLMVKSSTKIHLKYADSCQDDTPSNITYAETFQGKKGANSGIYKDQKGIFRLEDATITFYMKSIEESLKDPESENYGYSMTQAMGAEGTHESVHAADTMEVHKDISSANGGPKRTKNESEYKAKKKEREYRE